jgi:hypothetical protein
MTQPTVRDIQQMFSENPALAKSIKRLLELAVNERGYDFQEEEVRQGEVTQEETQQEKVQQEHINMLLSLSVIDECTGYRPIDGPDKKKVKYYILNFESFLVCYLMLELVQERTGQPLPEDPLAAIKYIDDFLVSSQTPDHGHRWYGYLDESLPRYALIWLNQYKGINVLHAAIRQAQLLADARRRIDNAYDQQTSLDIIKLINTAQEAIPYMNDPVEHIYELQVDVRESLHFGDFKEPLLALIAQQPAKAAALFEYMDSKVWKRNGELEELRQEINRDNK